MIKILQLKRGRFLSRYELHHGVTIKDDALVAAATLAERYLTERRMPDKAIDLIDEAASRLKMEQQSKPEPIWKLERKIVMKQIELEALKKETDPSSAERRRQIEESVETSKIELGQLSADWRRERAKLDEVKQAKAKLEEARASLDRLQRSGDLAAASELRYGRIPELEKLVADPGGGQQAPTHLKDAVTRELISEVVAMSTGIPVESLLSGEREKLLHLEDLLKARVVGQDETVEAVADCIRQSRTGLHGHGRPQGVFLFLGGTGTGKTELTKALAGALFDDEQSICRVDMSEYMEKHSVSRLIGAPPGYVGYEQGGALTEAVRRKPYQIILLDEFEKAHKDVVR